MKRITILLFNDVEILDFAGPLDTFLLANEHGGRDVFDIVTVAKTPGPVVAAYNGLSVNPDQVIADITQSDVLVVPGGDDISHVLSDPELIEWIKMISENAIHVLSVCSGSLILAKAGLLDGLEATTHHTDIDELISLAPETRVVDGVRFVDNGKVVTSAGITAGIDMSLHVVEVLCGKEIARKTAKSMEYGALE